jgi:hypothetical protein
MPADVNISRFSLHFRLNDDQGNQREIESPGGRIEMNDERCFWAVESKRDFVFSQITLNCFNLFHSSTLKRLNEKKLNRLNGYTLTIHDNQCRIMG